MHRYSMNIITLQHPAHVDRLKHGAVCHVSVAMTGKFADFVVFMTLNWVVSYVLRFFLRA